MWYSVIMWPKIYYCNTAILCVNHLLHRLVYVIHVFLFHGSLTPLTCSGLVDGGLSVSDIKLPCRTHPHWLEPTIYQSETPPERSSTPSECIGLEARSMVSVAVKISSQNAERNVKVEYSTHWWVKGHTGWQKSAVRLGIEYPLDVQCDPLEGF